jgi:hypothetical protein
MQKLHSKKEVFLITTASFSKDENTPLLIITLALSWTIKAEWAEFIEKPLIKRVTCETTIAIPFVLEIVILFISTLVSSVKVVNENVAISETEL